MSICMYCNPLKSANLNLSFNFIILCLCIFAHIQANAESVAIILTEDGNGFKSTVRATSFTCFYPEKGAENRENISSNRKLLIYLLRF